MAIKPTYPGVYVQEVPSGVRTITGVSTSIAMFIGRTTKGLLNKPVKCNSISDFEREFSFDSSLSEMPRQVRMFFENGGSECYALRIAKDAKEASVTLKSEDDKDVLKLTAKQAGSVGNLINVSITYGNLNPEIDFNMEVIRYEVKNGRKTIADKEEYLNLSMNKKSSRYAINLINQSSNLIQVKDLEADALLNGSSLSMRSLKVIAGKSELADIITKSQKEFNIMVNDFGPIHIDLKDLKTNQDDAQILESIEKEINNRLMNEGNTGDSVTTSLIDGPDSTKLFKIESEQETDVLVFPAGTNDLALPLMLGTAQGGLEVGSHSGRRPAPSGISLIASNPKYIIKIADTKQKDFKNITLDGKKKVFHSTGSEKKIYEGNNSVIGKLDKLRDFLNKESDENPQSFFWRASLNGYRLQIIPTKGEANKLDASFSLDSNNLTDLFIKNVKNYSLGENGSGNFQSPGDKGDNGNAPSINEYQEAFKVIDKDVNIFNLLILPKDNDEGAVKIKNVWGKASIFCQKKRAFLLMDAPAWGTAQKATSEIATHRIGLVKDHSAIFYPQLKVRENGLDKDVGPSGAIAGLMARIDSNRGVWKAPAGTEADIRGISGITMNLTDGENGDLNQRAINTIRSFPVGVVNWGARTMDGDDDFQSEYKYIPVRRLALYMEESLYRGLKWVVFEPNDEPLWAQIRLNVGAFMHNLFRQGAFQGVTSKEAFFVKCDKETTTQNDIDLGVVNIWVGFAPLKPAEFVMLYLQQIAGQIQS